MFADILDTIGFVKKTDPAVAEAMEKELRGVTWDELMEASAKKIGIRDIAIFGMFSALI